MRNTDIFKPYVVIFEDPLVLFKFWYCETLTEAESFADYLFEHKNITSYIYERFEIVDEISFGK